MLVAGGSGSLAAGGGHSKRCRPGVVTGRPTAVTPLSAILHGTVADCHRSGTRAWFVIVRAPGKASRSPRRLVARARSRVSFGLTGLRPGESVTVRLEAKVGRTVIDGKRVSFRARRLPIKTLAATSVTATSAVLHGMVDPNRARGLSGAFRWSPASGGPRRTTTGRPLPADARTHAFRFTLRGLEPSTQYQFDAVATARHGLVLPCGCTLKFTTAPSPPGGTPPGGTPTGVAPPLRYIYDDNSASAGYGFNLMDVGGKAGSDATPSGTRGLIWLGNYDNSTCQFQVSDAQVQSDLAGAAGDSKIAGYFLADEPDPSACPNAPAQIAARSQLVHKADTDPSHFTFMVMDSNSGSASLNQVPLWEGVTDYVGLDPYPCYQNHPCTFSWIDQIISAANSAGLNYWGVVQAFDDSTWRWPTADELTHMLNQWAASNETGYGVFAWTWSANNLTSQPSLLSVLQKFNATASSAATPAARRGA